MSKAVAVEELRCSRRDVVKATEVVLRCRLGFSWVGIPRTWMQGWSPFNESLPTQEAPCGGSDVTAFAGGPWRKKIFRKAAEIIKTPLL